MSAACNRYHASLNLPLFHQRTTRVLRMEHLQQLREYTKRIRHLQFVPSTQPIAPQIYSSIGKHAQLELFPTLSRLEILSLDQINMANISSLSLMLPPTLSDVTISSITPRVEILAATLLDDVTEKALKLRKLSLAGKITILCFNTIPALNSLQTLHIFSKDSVLPGNFVKIISQLDSLRWLHISLEDSSRWSPPGNTRTVGSPHGFRSLRKLNITGSSGFVLDLIGHVTPLPKLATINLHFFSDTSKESGKRLAECLVSLTGPDLLAIHITSKDIASSIERFPVPVPVKGRRWRLSSTRLQVLELEVGTFNSGSIRILSTSKFSSALQIIRIVASRGVLLVANNRDHVEVADLTSIYSFSNLQSLEISINLNLTEAHMKSIKKITEINKQCHKLRELTLVPYRYHTLRGDFNVKNAFIFARYINHLFPHLKKFDLSKFTTVDASWRQGVEAMVIGLQDVQKCNCHHRTGKHFA